MLLEPQKCYNLYASASHGESIIIESNATTVAFDNKATGGSSKRFH